jgi:hypothetical protein
MGHIGLTREEFYNLPIAKFHEVQYFLFIDQSGDRRFYYVCAAQDYGVVRHILMLDSVNKVYRSITDLTDIEEFTNIYPEIKN